MATPGASEGAPPAIPAARNWWYNQLLYLFMVRWSVWNSFDRVWVQIAGRLPRPDDGPLLCYMNHVSWWDGYMIGIVNQKILGHRFAAYIMMEEKQLKHYRFMTRAGAFSVHRQNKREAARSVAYISRILAERGGRALYMFPQGEIVPNDRRPIAAYTGLAHVVRRVPNVLLYPVALRYEFRGEERPEIFIRLGPAHRASTPVDIAALTQEVEQRLAASADALREAVVADDMGQFCPLLRGRPSINRLFDRVLGHKIEV